MKFLDFLKFIFPGFQSRKRVAFVKRDVGAGTRILMIISDGLDPSIFLQKMKRTRPMREEMDGNVFISRQSRHFSL